MRLPKREEGKEEGKEDWIGGEEAGLRLGRLVVKGQPRVVPFVPPALLVESLESNARLTAHHLLQHRLHSHPLPLASSQIRDAAGAGGGVVLDIQVDARAAVLGMTLETRHHAPAQQVAEVRLDVWERKPRGEGGQDGGLELRATCTHRLPLLAAGTAVWVPLDKAAQGGVVCVAMLRCYSGLKCTPAAAAYTKVQLFGYPAPIHAVCN